MTTARRTGVDATLGYDPEGRLVRLSYSNVATNLLYDGQSLVADYDAAGAMKHRYVFGPGVDAPLVQYDGADTNAKMYLYADQQGSIVASANSAGATLDSVKYGPFGETTGSTPRSNFLYTGQYYVAGLQLYYYKARMYAPHLGRFLQTDPVGTADDLNLYAYVGNNPINFSDPLGLAAESCPKEKAAEEQRALRAAQEKVRAAVGQSTPATMQQAGKISVPTTALNGALAGATSPVGRSGSPMTVPRGTNIPTTIDGIGYSGHAIDQMQGRGVPPSAVQNTIQSGVVYPTGAGTTGIYDSVNNVRVITNSATGLVITVIPGAPK
ncbi:RHS repeat-associated core domain-containing protein [Paraburkholderia caffeinilytica]|uniref:RHS repeat-associated core domain-containing protein n=1 Tax=Paraburkholderia caffeinilytica TaxID=1761016 RepID=UPI003DA193DC